MLKTCVKQKSFDESGKFVGVWGLVSDNTWTQQVWLPRQEVSSCLSQQNQLLLTLEGTQTQTSVRCQLALWADYSACVKLTNQPTLSPHNPSSLPLFTHPTYTGAPLLQTAYLLLVSCRQRGNFNRHWLQLMGVTGSDHLGPFIYILLLHTTRTGLFFLSRGSR